MNGTGRNPYVGPYAFEKEDAGFFYGREREAQLLPSLVISESLTLFFAQSGAGKTSFLNAKLVPELEREGFEVLPVARVGGELPAGIVPENVYAFNAVWSLTGSEQDPKSLRNLSLDEHLRLDAPDQSSPRRVLIFDQFEEILTTHPERWKHREDFFLQLREALLDDPALSIILVLREDHVAGLDRYAPLLPGQFRARFRMERLRCADAVQAVRCPALEAGRPFADKVAEELVENLSQLHLAGQAKTVAGEFVEPVQLQVVCYRLWENLRDKPGETITRDDLREFGKVDEALENFYETAVQEAVAAAGVPEERIRKWCGTRLITSSRIRSQVSREAATSGGLPNEAVDQLVKAHLVRPEQARGGTWYELAHDRFIDPVLLSNEEWNRQREKPLSADARAWQEADRSPLHLYRGQLLKAAKDLVKTDPEAFGELERDFLARSQEEETNASKKWVRLLAAALFIMIGLAALAFWQGRVARSRELALAAISRSEADPELGLLLALEALDKASTLEAEAALHGALDASVVRRVWLEPYHAANEVAFSPDGTRLAVVGKRGEVGVWDTTSHQLVFPLPGKGAPSLVSLTSVAFSPTGDRLAIGDNDGRIEIRDAVSWRALLILPNGSTVNGLAFSPDGKQLAVAGDSPEVKVWNLETGNPPRVLRGHEDTVWDVAFNPAGDLLASAGEDGRILVWSLKSGKRLPDLPLQAKPVNGVAFSRDGKLATAGQDGTAKIWDLERPEQEVRTFYGHRDWLWDLDFSQDGRYLVTGSFDGSAKIWDLASGDDIYTLLPGRGSVVSVAFSSRTGEVSVASLPSGESVKGAATLWKVLLDADVPTLVSPGSSFDTVSFSPDSQMVATSYRNGQVTLWSSSGEPIRTSPSAGSLLGMKFAKDGAPLRTAVRAPGKILLFDLGRPVPERVLPIQGDRVKSLSFSQDGLFVAATEEDGVVRIWETETPKIALELRGQNPIVDARFSPDGQSLATVDSEGSARLWDRSAGRELQPLERSSGVLQVTFSPDGERLAGVGADNTILLWETASGKLLFDPLEGHAAGVTGVEFSSDGKLLATSSLDSTVKLWDARLGRELFTLRGHSSGVSALAFSPDQKLLATVSSDKVRLEPLTIGDLTKLARKRLEGRELTDRERQIYLRR